MRDLRLVGVHEDGQHLLLSDGDGGRYQLALDDALRAAARRDRPRLGQLQIELEGGMRPREVQALVRSGLSAEEVADRAGWTVEKVRRYEGPVLAEREYIADLARGVRMRQHGQSTGQTLAARVAERLVGRGVDSALAAWDAARDAEGQWTVLVLFPAGGRERTATWAFDVTARTVSARDDEARWLSEDDAEPAGPIPTPHQPSATGGPTTVYDVESDGGVAGARPQRRGGEPTDLMTAMRESSSRGRRSRRRTHQPTLTPVDDAPREDALPLEPLAQETSEQDPPPAAHGTHPRDEAMETDEGAATDETTAPEAPSPEPAEGPDDDRAPGASDTGRDGDEPDAGEPDEDAGDPDDPADEGAADPPGPDDAVAAAEPDAEDCDEPTEQATTPPAGAEVSAPAAAEVSDASTGPADGESESEPGEAESAGARPAGPRGSRPRRGGRTSVPRWDDIMFGGRGSAEPPGGD